MDVLNDLDFKGASRISGLLDPLLPQDAVTKSYLESMDAGGVSLGFDDFWQYSYMGASAGSVLFGQSILNSGIILATSATMSSNAPFGATYQSTAIALSGARSLASATSKEFIGVKTRKFVTRLAFASLDTDLMIRIGWLNSYNGVLSTQALYFSLDAGQINLVSIVGGVSTVLSTIVPSPSANTVYTFILEVNGNGTGWLKAQVLDQNYAVIGNVVGDYTGFIPTAALNVGILGLVTSATAKDILICHSMGYGTIAGFNSWAKTSKDIQELEVDFGTTFVSQKKFTITDSRVGVNSRVNAWQSGRAATGRDADENEMDQLHVVATPFAGGFYLIVTCLSGKVGGKYKINYQLA